MMTFTSNSNTSGSASSEAPTLTSLPKPQLLQIMSLLDTPSLKHLRLTNKLLECTANELITCIKYGTAPDCCNAAQLEHVAERWPSIKIIKVFCMQGHFKSLPNHYQEIRNAITCLLHAKWTGVEEIKFQDAFPLKFPCALDNSGARALAACTVSLGRLRKLKMQNTVWHEGLDILATHGEFPSLEELDLSYSNFSICTPLAGTALAKLASRAPKLCTLNLRRCRFK